MKDKRTVSDKRDLEKDMESQGVINRDRSAFERARAVKQRIMDEKEQQKNIHYRVGEMEQRISGLEQKMDAILNKLGVEHG